MNELIFNSRETTPEQPTIVINVYMNREGEKHKPSVCEGCFIDDCYGCNTWSTFE